MCLTSMGLPVRADDGTRQAGVTGWPRVRAVRVDQRLALALAVVPPRVRPSPIFLAFDFCAGRARFGLDSLRKRRYHAAPAAKKAPMTGDRKNAESAISWACAWDGAAAEIVDRAEGRCGRGPPRLRLPRRERRLRPGGDRRRAGLDRPEPPGDPRPGRQGHRPAHRPNAPEPRSSPGTAEPVAGPDEVVSFASGPRPTRSDQGSLRRRRSRLKGGPDDRGDPGAARVGLSGRRRPPSAAASASSSATSTSPVTSRPRYSRTSTAT